jgi:hypothetical protein
MDCSSGMSGTLGTYTTWGYMGCSSRMPGSLGTLGTLEYSQYLPLGDIWTAAQGCPVL